MGLFSREIKVMLTMVDGLQSVKKGLIVTLTLHEDELTIKENFARKEPIHLKYDQIINAGVLRESEIIEKSKNVLGRAAVGGLVLGPFGAIVGSVSGIGSKEKKKINTFFIINYKSSHDEELKVLTFSAMDNGNSIGLSKFDKELKEKIGIKEEVINETYL